MGADDEARHRPVERGGDLRERDRRVLAQPEAQLENAALVIGQAGEGVARGGAENGGGRPLLGRLTAQCVDERSRTASVTTTEVESAPDL